MIEALSGGSVDMRETWILYSSNKEDEKVQ